MFPPARFRLQAEVFFRNWRGPLTALIRILSSTSLASARAHPGRHRLNACLYLRARSSLSLLKSKGQRGQCQASEFGEHMPCHLRRQRTQRKIIDTCRRKAQRLACMLLLVSPEAVRCLRESGPRVGCAEVIICISSSISRSIAEFFTHGAPGSGRTGYRRKRRGAAAELLLLRMLLLQLMFPINLGVLRASYVSRRRRPPAQSCSISCLPQEQALRGRLHGVR